MKNKEVLVLDPVTQLVHKMNAMNANDMVVHRGWVLTDKLPTNACEVCFGHGVYPHESKETCWHCEGEGIDPSL